MDKETEDLLKDNRETLETLAQSDLRSSKWASMLLESITGDTSYSFSKPIETDIDRDISPKNPPEEQHKDPPEPEGSIFAF